MPGKVVAKGIKWSSNRIDKIPHGACGVYIIFNESNKSTIIKDCMDIQMTLREEWWKKNFWYFTWFATKPSEYRNELIEELRQKDYDELWNLSLDQIK